MFFLHKRQYQWRVCFCGFARCVGRAEQSVQFFCALQLGRMSLGRQRGAACLEPFSWIHGFHFSSGCRRPLRHRWPARA